VVTYINLNRGFAFRVNSVGIFDEKLGIHRKPVTIKGVADISAIINGKAWQIEVKVGRDRQSEHQKNFQQRVEQAGGVYLIVKSFDDFVGQYQAVQAAQESK